MFGDFPQRTLLQLFLTKHDKHGNKIEYLTLSIFCLIINIYYEHQWISKSANYLANVHKFTIYIHTYKQN